MTDVFEPIHQLRRVQKGDKGSLLTVGARCGYEATRKPNGPMPEEFSAWPADVTCPACLHGPAVCYGGVVITRCEAHPPALP